MTDARMPPAPTEQVLLRARLERRLSEWSVPYRHVDQNSTSADGRGVTFGWGTHIDRGPDRPSLEVWFDGLDLDVAVSGDRRSEYYEWRDLSSITDVLDGVEAAVGALLRPTQ